ncbi:MAG: DNA translocase FtsK 4TM domain-containing protein, partial [Pseudomonadota bacterium]
MAYQARTRDPLFDRETQAQLERRARELIGLILMAAGVVTAMILGTYSPDDPSFLSATDVQARNLLGRFGASIASPLFVIAGFGAWGLSILGLVWGLRFCCHDGADRAFTRLIFAPIAIALASVYASTHVPMPGWTHSFGLGGLFGDTVLGALLGILPIKATLGLKVLSVFLGTATIAMGLFVLGVTRRELRAFWRFLLRGSVMAYARLMDGAMALAEAAAILASRIVARRAARRDAE